MIGYQTKVVAIIGKGRKLYRIVIVELACILMEK
jgi:hypothetical protein